MAALNWTDYFTAVGTVGAVVVSLGIASVSAITARQRRKADATQRLHELQRAQAEKVTWWVEPCAEHASPYAGFVGNSTVHRTRTLGECWGSVVIVRNASSLQIQAVTLELSLDIIVFDDKVPTGAIGANRDWTQHLAGAGHSLLLDRSFVRGPDAIAFRDGQGRNWTRTVDGLLREDSRTPLERGQEEELRQSRLRAVLRGYAEQAVQGDLTSCLGLPRRARDIRMAHGSKRVAVVRWQRHLGRSGDRIAFRALQSLPTASMDRRIALDWYRWRAGEISGPEFESLYSTWI